ncbi:hypothetical protein, partial [uncultured Jatrophihabitans sp.]|uniref:hypothetical protein n=1 Tax=uncultured Jatrophihabitans sp. TaxID=1610747 RepID=UPI0035CAE0D5
VGSPCTTSLTNSLIGGYPKFACKHGVPGRAVGRRSGNRLGTPRFVNRRAGNLHLRRGYVAQLHAGTLLAKACYSIRDIDGQPLAPTTLGADQPGAASPAHKGPRRCRPPRRINLRD